MEKSRFVPGTYVYVGLAVGVGVSAIIGGIACPTFFRSMYPRLPANMTRQTVDGALAGVCMGGIVGLVLAAIGWVIGIVTGKRHIKGFRMWWWAVWNAVICGAATLLFCWIVIGLLSIGFMGGH